jgi:hypothetical protein
LESGELCAHHARRFAKGESAKQRAIGKTDVRTGGVTYGETNGHAERDEYVWTNGHVTS